MARRVSRFRFEFAETFSRIEEANAEHESSERTPLLQSNKLQGMRSMSDAENIRVGIVTSSGDCGDIGTRPRAFKKSFSQQCFGLSPRPPDRPPDFSHQIPHSSSDPRRKLTAVDFKTPLSTKKQSLDLLSIGSRTRLGERTIIEGLEEAGTKMKDIGKSVKSAAEDELRYEAVRFAALTTAHGIPMAVNATKWYAKTLWLVLSFFSAGIFVYQCVLVYDKFQRKEKIVNVQLQFDNAPFPAVTICNLNPFKKHLALKVPEISETLDAYHQAVTYSKHADQHYDESPPARARRNVMGGFRYVQFEPVMSDCECSDDFSSQNILSNWTGPTDYSTTWPCYNRLSWMEAFCPECNDIGYCNLPETNGTDVLPCLCQKNVSYCLLRPERLKRMWEIRGKAIPEEGSPFRKDFLEQLQLLGYENMTDEVAITTKTKEKLVLTMAGLPYHRRISLSYGKSEFIKMCSFNGQQCNIINDFKLHVDPGFGNCYTFNAEKSRSLLSSRAGPSYGLRLLVYINETDYLPTTQASGVRIAIHSQEEFPFPEAFGYSAPTNQLSSFGLSLRKVNRLPIPRGDCLMPEEPLPKDYIYPKYKYDPEGCYKSCYQNRIIKICGCADPRYPMASNHTKLCDSFDLLARNCLMVEGTRFSRGSQCNCKHPCVRDVYTTTFSSARLTSDAFKAAQCTNRTGCSEFDSESAAMLEIYYEQMSHEILSESESYLFVNFMSDVGGQAGLWLGASILTLFEVVVFVLRLLTIFCRRRFRRGTADYDNTHTPSHKTTANEMGDFGEGIHGEKIKRKSSSLTTICTRDDGRSEVIKEDKESRKDKDANEIAPVPFIGSPNDGNLRNGSNFPRIPPLGRLDYEDEVGVHSGIGEWFVTVDGSSDLPSYGQQSKQQGDENAENENYYVTL